MVHRWNHGGAGFDRKKRGIAMKTSHTGSESQTPAVALRQRAEGIAREKAIRIPENIESLSVEAARQMLHELRVHQIELEMQNEELRRAQTELNAARARYFDLYDLAPVGYCTLSEQKLILEANLTAATLLGVARGALVKQPITRFIFKQDQDLYYKHLKQLFESGEPQACELRMVKMDGAPVWVGLEATVAQDADGMPVCRAVLSDITKRKQSEEALRETRNYLDNLIDYANAPIITWDTEYRITRFNHAFERLTGYTAEEVSGRELFILFPETSCDESLNKIKRSSIGECWESMDLPIRRKDGVIRLVLWNSANIYAQDGKTIIANIAQGWDITERQQAEKALKESENNYRLLADNVNDVIFVLDMNLNYTYISPSVKILRGYEPEEVLKLSPIETLTPSSWDLAVRTVSEAMELEKSEHRDISISWTLQLEMRRKDGTTVWTEVKLSFIRDEGQRPVGILGVTREITERKQAEDSLKETLESLRKAVGVTIQVMVSAVETRDPYTAGHQVRSANLARNIAAEMGLPQEKIDGIRMAGSIHDIGKLSIPAEILSKPTKLSDIEFSLIKEHARQGYEILRNVESPWPLAEMVYQHHERMDGSGYPRNLKGDEILIEARILAVADVVESMASHRPYRAGLGIEAALEEIEKNKGVFYDPDVVETCLRLFREKGYRLVEA